MRNPRRKWEYKLIGWIALAILTVGIYPPIGRSENPDCAIIYNPGNGWIIDHCPTDPNVVASMQVLLNGTVIGNSALVRVYHQSQYWPGIPQVAVIYASGYLRLKPNADPQPPIPFGGSFILGPAYWADSGPYYHNPQLDQLIIDTSDLPGGLLHMQAVGSIGDFAVSYDLAFPPPRDDQTRLHVTQTYTATHNIQVDTTRIVERQGFKLAQVSTMYINQNEACDGQHNACHDSDAARFIGSDLARHEVAFKDLILPSFIFNPQSALSSTWLDVLHTDDQSWQGNTPNLRIALDVLPGGYTITPQGWIGAVSDPNEDNANIWLHDDRLNVNEWPEGRSEQVSYWLLAEDNPFEPWISSGLRSGFTFLDFESTNPCFLVLPSGSPVTGTAAPIAGYSDTAYELSYNLGSDNGNWAQVRCNFNPPLNLSAYDHLRIDWRGDPETANSIQVGLINPGDGQDKIFARGYHHATQRGWWGQLVIPFSFLAPWTQGSAFDPGQVSALFVSVVKDPLDDTGGAGSLAIDNLNAFNVLSRSVPGSFETPPFHFKAAKAAAQWLASQQRPSGLLRSWQEETTCAAHTYDQALALIVFSSRRMWPQADALVGGLVTTQNEDGSWFKSRDCDSLLALDSNKWEGDIAWAVYALSRYHAMGGKQASAVVAMQKGAAWLAGRVAPDGCLLIDHTEATLDAWWAFSSAGPDFLDETDAIESCLLTYYWDDAMGRFKGGRDWQQPYLDNQTWGAAFLKAVGETDQARRALSYAWEVLRLPAQGGQLFGLDGQAGPWSIWNEGLGQYAAIGGQGASDLILELLSQQTSGGAMPGSTDEFGGGGVWTTRWHGVAPTAWLYNALCGGPFYPGSTPRCLSIYLPILYK